MEAFCAQEDKDLPIHDNGEYKVSNGSGNQKMNGKSQNHDVNVVASPGFLSSILSFYQFNISLYSFPVRNATFSV
jgi:hypothetical protein